MNARLLHLPPWPTGWSELRFYRQSRPPIPAVAYFGIDTFPQREAVSAKEGGLSFAGLFHGDAVFRLDDVFFGAGVLWQVDKFAFDPDTYTWGIGATSIASLQDLVDLIPHS